MPVQLNVTVPDDLMDWLTEAAGRDFRTPEGQLLWLAKSAWADELRRGPAGDAAKELTAALQRLHVSAGSPSSRTIAALVREKGGKVSHTTVNGALTGAAVPSWPVTERIVAALGGDPEDYRKPWGLCHGPRQRRG